MHLRADGTRMRPGDAIRGPKRGRDLGAVFAHRERFPDARAAMLEIWHQSVGRQSADGPGRTGPGRNGSAPPRRRGRQAAPPASRASTRTNSDACRCTGGLQASRHLLIQTASAARRIARIVERTESAAHVALLHRIAADFPRQLPGETDRRCRSAASRARRAHRRATRSCADWPRRPRSPAADLFGQHAARRPAAKVRIGQPGRQHAGIGRLREAEPMRTNTLSTPCLNQ